LPRRVPAFGGSAGTAPTGDVVIWPPSDEQAGKDDERRRKEGRARAEDVEKSAGPERTRTAA
jgi:hypothetical protein